MIREDIVNKNMREFTYLNKELEVYIWLFILIIVIEN